MKLSIDGQEIEYALSLKGISLAMAGAGLLMIFFGEFSADPTLRVQFYNLMLLLVSAAGVILVSADVHETLAKWFTLGAQSAIILLAVDWLHLPALATLLVIPISLAALLCGLKVLLALAVLDGGLVAGLAYFYPGYLPLSIALITLFAIGSLCAVQVNFYRQIVGVGTWSVGYWQKANQYNASAQESRANMEKALKNLANANELLIQSERRTERLRLHAENAEKSKAMFVARVSHEFRTPLNMIIGLVELMVESPQIYALRMPPELEKDLEIVLRNCKHLATMIDDVLELTRAESGSLTLHREWVNLFEIIHEACQVVSPLIKKKGLDLEIQVPESLPEIYCDRTRIRQVVMNLVSNASRFTVVGKITILLEMTGETILASITDTGPGIAPEYSARIFEPFYQGAEENTYKEKGGSGLGLTISKQFVELHGGQMWLKSQPGQGSTFFFTLPVQMRSEFSTTPRRWIRPDWVWHEHDFVAARLEDAGNLVKPRILILDETQGLLSQFDYYSDPFKLVVCQDVDDLHQRARENQPDLIWINTQAQPGFLELSAALIRCCPGVPVVGSMIPASNSLLETSRRLNYLTKPITLAKLQESIASLGAAARHVLIVDDDADVQDLLGRMLAVINPQIRTVSLASGEEALNYLAERPLPGRPLPGRPLPERPLPDLLLLDVVMTGKSGFEVLAELRKEEKTRQLPVLFISAQDLVHRHTTSPAFFFISEQGLSLKRLIESSIRLSNLLPSTGIKPDLMLE